MKHLRFALFAVLANVFVATQVMADANEELYDATAPANSAFVRLLNTQQQPANFSIGGFDKTFLVGATQVSPYLFLPPGDYQISAGSAQLGVSLPEAQAFTLVFDGNEIVPIKDQMPENAQRALVAFYNLSATESALKTVDGSVDLVSALAPRTAGFREINEVRMPFAAFDDSQAQATFDPLLLRKGRSYSFVIIDDGAAPLRSFATINQVGSPE